MTDDIMTNAEEKEVAVVADAQSVAPAVVAPAAPAAPAERRGDRRSRGPRRGPRTQRPERKSEFDQKILAIRRVARVMKGGRRFSFSVAIVIGNRKGRV